MSADSDKAFEDWYEREYGDSGSNSHMGSTKRCWDAALSWCRPLAIAAIKKAKSRKRQPKKTRTLKEAVTIPDWLPIEVWRGFEDMRVRIRAPLTEYAAHLIIKKLIELKDQGEDPIACLNESTQKSWRGIFPVYKNRNGNIRSSSTPLRQIGDDND
jgi:hypothetical protein